MTDEELQRVRQEIDANISTRYALLQSAGVMANVHDFGVIRGQVLNVFELSKSVVVKHYSTLIDRVAQAKLPVSIKKMVIEEIKQGVIKLGIEISPEKEEEITAILAHLDEYSRPAATVGLCHGATMQKMEGFGKSDPRNSWYELQKNATRKTIDEFDYRFAILPNSGGGAGRPSSSCQSPWHAGTVHDAFTY